ncbi:hypothetical protein [Glutamicibacter mishrai]|uniref:hypothetical protein n=1 Tax=Glutamicibacter mishrai TaxID=1775880 RepID=UPI003F7A3983
MAPVSADPSLLVFSVSGFSPTSAVLSVDQDVVEHLLHAQDLDVANLGAIGSTDRFDSPQI